MNKAPLIGMIHLPRLTYDSEQSIESIIEYAISEGRKLEMLKYSGIMVENFSDSPFVKSKVDDTVLIKMTLIMQAMKQEVKIPLGVNLLRNASVQALQIASMLDLSFIRCNIYEGAYVTDQGIIEGAALEVQEMKNRLQSNVKVYADIHVKHAYQMGEFSILESAENAILRGKADNVIVSGISTGRAVDISKLKILAEHGFKPIIGSGLNLSNMESYKGLISGAIVGSSIKETDVLSPINVDKASMMIDKWNNFF